MRSFLAVLLPDDVRRRLDAAATGLRRQAPAVAWVRADNLHLTLRFLGSVDETTLGRAREALEATAEATPPFPVTLGGFGGFPGARAPRVVWAGVTVGAEALIALHARLEAALAARGIPSEGRPFHPHVTLGRARSPRGAPELAGPLGPGGGGAAEAIGELVVDAVHLMRSDLAPGGARYGVLARGALRGTPARRGAPAPDATV